jgi:hypothetical protein
MLPGVFCLEGQWDNDLTDRSSVRPTLELLERLSFLQFIHKNVATAGDLDYFLGRWTLRAYSAYSVGYLAMHGSPAALELSHGNSVTLHHIAQRLEGKCDGKRLYFGSCSVLNASEEQLRDFLEMTRAELICGYTKEVEWDESSAFDTVLLSRLAYGNERELLDKSHWTGLVEKLGFRIVYRDRRKNSRTVPSQRRTATRS